MRTFISNSSEQTEKIGERIGSELAESLEAVQAGRCPGRVIALRGGLGSGKTTLVKGLARGFGVSDEVTSPSYTIINEYQVDNPSRSCRTVSHVDLYRLATAEEFQLMGSDEILYGEGVAVIEWSEKIDALLPTTSMFITIELSDDGSRSISIQEGKRADTRNRHIH